MSSIISKLRELYKSYGYEAWVFICVLLAAFIGYNFGRIRDTAGNGGVNIGQNAAILEAINNETVKTYTAGKAPQNIPSPTPKDLRVVVSKASDSKKYHYSWCSSWKKIKPENQVWFENEKAAQAAGYTLALNCE